MHEPTWSRTDLVLIASVIRACCRVIKLRKRDLSDAIARRKDLALRERHDFERDLSIEARIDEAGGEVNQNAETPDARTSVDLTLYVCCKSNPLDTRQQIELVLYQ